MRRIALALAIVSALGCNAFSGIDDFHVGVADDGDAIVFPNDTIDTGAIETIARSDSGVGEADVGSDSGAAIDAGPTDSGVDTIDAPIEIGCPTHSNGLGGTYVDCAPLAMPGVASSYTIGLAMKARGAWSIALSGGDQETVCGDGSKLVFRYAATETAAWAYSGPMAGHVHHQTAGGAPYCPTLADPTWD